MNEREKAIQRPREDASEYFDEKHPYGIEPGPMTTKIPGKYAYCEGWTAHARLSSPPAKEANEEFGWLRWGERYPASNGLYVVRLRASKEVWVAYWNNNLRRFEEAVPQMTEKGVDVDYWQSLPEPFKNHLP